MKVKNIMFFGFAAAILSAGAASAAPNYSTVSDANIAAGRKIVASKSYVDSQANKLEADITAVATSAVSNLDYAGNNGAGVVTNVTQADGVITATKAQITDSEVASDAAIAQSKISGLTDALAAKEVSSNKSSSGLITADEQTHALTAVAAGTADAYASTSALSSDFTKIKDAIGAVNASIPTVNNAALTVQKNGTTVATFTANDATAQTANIEVNNGQLTVTGKGSGETVNFTADQAGNDSVTVSDVPLKPTSCSDDDPCILMENATGYAWFHMVTDSGANNTQGSYTGTAAGSVITNAQAQ